MRRAPPGRSALRAHHRSLIAALALIVVAIAALAASRWRDEPGAGDATAARRTHAGLCATVGAAIDDDVALARAVFYDRSHDGLHELAARATEVDRAAAARLLETKQRVEALLEGAPPPAELVSALDRLADATATAADVTRETEVDECS